MSRAAHLKTFREAVRTKDFTLSAELRLDSRTTAASLTEQAEMLSPVVDAVQVTDNPGSRVHMSHLVAAGILLNHGIDPVLHMSCRDRNRIALHSDLLGAAELGITSLLLMRGQKFPVDYPTKAKAVFDWGGNRLIEDACALQSDTAIGNPPTFFIGSIATAFNPTRGWKPEKMAARADAGIKFIQTQLCFDTDMIRSYIAGLVAARLLERISVIVGIAPIPSVEIGEWLAGNLRAKSVPDAVLSRLRESSDPERVGIEICAEMLRELEGMPGVSGANIVSFGGADNIARAIELSGLQD